MGSIGIFKKQLTVVGHDGFITTSRSHELIDISGVCDRADSLEFNNPCRHGTMGFVRKY